VNLLFGKRGGPGGTKKPGTASQKNGISVCFDQEKGGKRWGQGVVPGGSGRKKPLTGIRGEIGKRGPPGGKFRKQDDGGWDTRPGRGQSASPSTQV